MCVLKTVRYESPAVNTANTQKRTKYFSKYALSISIPDPPAAPQYLNAVRWMIPHEMEGLVAVVEPGGDGGGLARVQTGVKVARDVVTDLNL